MHLINLTSNGFNHVDLAGKRLKTVWGLIKSTMKTRARGDEPAVPTAQAFAINACAPGRYILQVGANHAHVARELKRKLCHVTAIAFETNQAANESKTSVPPSPALCLPENTAWFDEILLLDLIERLPAPESFMEELRQKMARRGSEVVITASNVVSFVSRIMIALGRLACGRGAIPIGGRGRLFTFKSLRALLERAGYEILEVRGVPVPFPLAIGESRWSRGLLKLNQVLLRISKHLFAYQICMRARPLPRCRQVFKETSSSGAALYPQALGRVA